MRFGDFHLLECPTGLKAQHQVYREALDQVRCAEELGLHWKARSSSAIRIT